MNKRLCCKTRRISRGLVFVQRLHRQEGSIVELNAVSKRKIVFVCPVLILRTTSAVSSAQRWSASLSFRLASSLLTPGRFDLSAERRSRSRGNQSSTHCHCNIRDPGVFELP
ncbi:hypothetical protein DIPPA_52591 [Diplonema papillatum]|nr:hypothetical protein DIPPA_52591 [Diplonema papillatum]